MTFIRPLFVLHALFFFRSSAVDRSNFKTCEQSSFCKRHRSFKSNTGYHVEMGSVKFNATSLEAILSNDGDNRLKLWIVALEDSTFRVLIDEAEGLRPRFQPVDALNGAPKQANLKTRQTNDEKSSMSTFDGNKVLLRHKPFSVDFFTKDILVSSINSQGLLHFEHFTKRQPGKSYRDGFWEENFKQFRDSKPHGSSSVGVDITFSDLKFIYGLPEHADSFALRNTGNGDPYRLYNLDVAEYEIGNPMALYGSIPFVTAVNPQRTVGALWLNAAETWVDVSSKGKSWSDLAFGTTSPNTVSTHFMSESGLIDVFLFLGPKPSDLFRQYGSLTGTYPIPPLFSLAYHQCRWNYRDEKDVAAVHAGFDQHDIPIDVMWLDIEHTDGKKYFTWDPVKFAHPTTMIDALAQKVGLSLTSMCEIH